MTGAEHFPLSGAIRFWRDKTVRGKGKIAVVCAGTSDIGMRRLGDEFIREWRPHSDGSFLMVALAPAGTEDDAWWLVDLASRKVVSGSGNCGEDRAWTVSAPAATWLQVIRDGLNLGVAFRRHGMRYRDRGGGGAGSTAADHRVSMMADLLGIITWNPGNGDRPEPRSGQPKPARPLSRRPTPRGITTRTMTIRRHATVAGSPRLGRPTSTPSSGRPRPPSRRRRRPA